MLCNDFQRTLFSGDMTGKSISSRACFVQSKHHTQVLLFYFFNGSGEGFKGILHLATIVQCFRLIYFFSFFLVGFCSSTSLKYRCILGVFSRTSLKYRCILFIFYKNAFKV